MGVLGVEISRPLKHKNPTLNRGGNAARVTKSGIVDADQDNAKDREQSGS